MLKFKPIWVMGRSAQEDMKTAMAVLNSAAQARAA
jgi:hypothetical protein